MSKKRNKNKRKKQIKIRHAKKLNILKKNTTSVLNELGYEVTHQPVDDKDVRNLPNDVQDQMDDLYDRVQVRPEGTIEELQELTLKYPHIPQFFNYLYTAYAKSGQETKAVEIMKKNYEANPSYLFAKLNYSDYLVESGELEKAGGIYNEKFDLHELYPERRKFHTTEVISFHGVIGYYHAVMGRYEKAKHCFRVLKALSPDHGYTMRLEDKLKMLGILII
ncbi:MAG: hypothetical protein B6I22_05810 [Desulfobacteraceae bacterium 4572_123]|nr:MAG: hypothetical protein B6I22_05810 [Desulfobacteraceae bacterium 4572_123]